MTNIEFSDYQIRPSKHFILGWMRKWSWDLTDLKNALDESYRLEKVGKCKYELYTKNKGKSKKIIFVVDEDYKEIFIITGAEGK